MSDDPDALLREATSGWAAHLLGECDPETCDSFDHRSGTLPGRATNEGDDDR